MDGGPCPGSGGGRLDGGGGRPARACGSGGGLAASGGSLFGLARARSPPRSKGVGSVRPRTSWSDRRSGRSASAAVCSDFTWPSIDHRSSVRTRSLSIEFFSVSSISMSASSKSRISTDLNASRAGGSGGARGGSFARSGSVLSLFGLARSCAMDDTSPCASSRASASLATSKGGTVVPRGGRVLW